MKKISLLGILGILLVLIGFIGTFLRGNSDTPSIIIISVGAAVTLFYIFMDIKNIFSFLKSKGFQYGTNSFLMVVIFLAILIFLQMIVTNKKVQFDLTENKRFSLSEQTVKILDNLKQDIDVVAFVEKGREGIVKDLLEQYKIKSPKFKYDVVDPNKNPGLAKKYEIKKYGTLIIKSDIKTEMIEEFSEEKITNTLIKVTKEGSKTIYFSEGHGEKTINDLAERGIGNLKDALNKQNYEVKSLVLAKIKEIPNDASVFIISGATKDFLPEEEVILKNYVKKGGSLIVLVDPDASQSINKFVENYGITVVNDFIVDQFSTVFGADFLMPIVDQNSYSAHPITQNFRVMTIFPLATSLQQKNDVKDASLEILASTSQSSWGETDKEMLKNKKLRFDQDKDLKGPLPIAILSKVKVEGKENGTSEKEKVAKVLVFGDSDFIANANLKIFGNSDLMLNSISWLADEDDLIAIRAKDPQNTPLILTGVQNKIILLVNLILLPVSIIFIAVFVLTKRRFKTV